MTLFRPCIDIHNGQVKQIVGSSLNDTQPSVKTNFVSTKDAAYYARLYREDELAGGHVIKLGPGNEAAAKSAIAAWPGGLQLGGGITPDNANTWIDAGAGQLIVTSWLFQQNNLDLHRVETMRKAVGKNRLVVDISCKKVNDSWFVATNRWQTVTETQITPKLLDTLSTYCDQYLIHAADVEGKCQGIDLELVHFLGSYCPIPCTYAGGAKCISDLQTVKDASNGRVDLTYGSALDLFGGTLVAYKECVNWNRCQQ